MSSNPSKLKGRLLLRLIESYESGASFGRDGEWARDVIVRLDGRTFPTAFVPDGAGERYALYDAAAALEREGALRMIFDKGVRRDLPKEVRLGPGELAGAYAAGRAFGIRPLADALAAVASAAEELRAPGLPAWMDVYLAELALRLRQGDSSLLGAARPRLKEREEDIRDALSAATFLARGEGGMERIVSERVFGRSKRLAEVRSWVRTILEAADPHWRGAPPSSATALLEHYGIRAKPVFLFCAGGIEYAVPSGTRTLLDDAPSSAVPEGIVAALASAAAGSGELTITTIENETAYHLYVEEQGGPEGLHASREMVVYAGGYPSSVVLHFLADAARGPQVRFRHWGDPDGDGFRIWWLIRSRIGRSVELLRMDAAWVEHAARRESRALNSGDRDVLLSVARTLGEHPEPGLEDLVDAASAISAVLAAGKWIEQERHYAR